MVLLTLLSMKLGLCRPTGDPPLVKQLKKYKYVQGSSLTILFFVLKFQKNPIIFINDTLSIGILLHLQYPRVQPLKLFRQKP